MGFNENLFRDIESRVFKKYTSKYTTFYFNNQEVSLLIILIYYLIDRM